MKKAKPIILLLAAVLALTLCACGSSSGSSSGSNSSSSSTTSNPVPEEQVTDATPPVVVVSGTNEEMGKQYATQQPDLIYRNVCIMKAKVVQQYGSELCNTDMQVWSYYADKYNPELRGWLEGMQAGLKEAGYTVDYLDLVLATVYSAEMWCRPDVTEPYPEETGVQLPESVTKAEDKGELHSCTMFTAEGEATEDGEPLIGVTKMITAEKLNSIVLIAFPSDGNSFICNPVAGQVAENAGMNSEGLAWTFTAQWGEPIWGVTNEVDFQLMCQKMGSAEEAIEYLNSIPRAGVTGAFLMTSEDGGAISYESLSNVSMTREYGESGESADVMVQTNHLVNSKLQSYNGSLSGESWNRYATMLAKLEKAASNGGITVNDAKSAFASDDWLEYGTDNWTYNDPGSEGGVNDNTSSTAQAIFHPSDMTAYFEVGTPNGVGLPAYATGEYAKYTLLETPAAITKDNCTTAQEYYWAARNTFVKMKNDGKLSYEVAESIEAILDKAAEELELGMDREGFATLADEEGTNVSSEMGLWGDALTHYTATQMYAQMASTKLAAL